MKTRQIDWFEYQGMVSEIARQIALTEWRPDTIVGITRGGALAAVMLSHYFKCKMVGLDVSLRDGGTPEHNLILAEEAANGKKILIVDDIKDTGATINWIISDWESSEPTIGREQKWGINIKFAVLIDNEASDSVLVPSYFAEAVNKFENPVWVIFPYENWWVI
jgi:hypoxanthine phosphoribosyltransferase